MPRQVPVHGTPVNWLPLRTDTTKTVCSAKAGHKNERSYHCSENCEWPAHTESFARHKLEEADGFGSDTHLAVARSASYIVDATRREFLKKLDKHNVSTSNGCPNVNSTEKIIRDSCKFSFFNWTHVVKWNYIILTGQRMVVVHSYLCLIDDLAEKNGKFALIHNVYVI